MPPPDALSIGPDASAAVVTLRPRDGSAIWPALEYLGGLVARLEGKALVGVRADLARNWLGTDVPDPTTLPRKMDARRFPSTQSAFFVQLAPRSADELTAALRELDALTPTCWRDEEVVGGWGAEHREPFGFRERASASPTDAQRVRILSGPCKGGCWVLHLTFEVDRARFLRLRERERESVIGAHVDGTHDSAARDDAHVPSVHPWASELLRRGFPFRRAGTEGLVFVAAARSPSTFDRALDAMLGDARRWDRLLDYAEPVSGGIYFVPASLPTPP